MPANPLTDEQLADAARLKRRFAEWQKRSKDAGEPFSQEDVTEMLGFNQSALSQYINGRIPLNVDAATKFARLIGCAISDFSPTLGDQASLYAATAAPDAADASGEPRLRVVAPRATQRRLQWVTDTEAELLSEFRACAEPQKERVLTFVHALQKSVSDEAGIDHSKG